MLLIDNCSASPDKNDPMSPKAGGGGAAATGAGGAGAAAGVGVGRTGAGSTTDGSAETGVVKVTGVLEEAEGVAFGFNTNDDSGFRI